MRCVFGDPKKAPPPLERLSPRDAALHVWNGEGSFVEDLIQSISPHMDDSLLSEFKASVQAHDPSTSENVEMALRKSLLWLEAKTPCTFWYFWFIITRHVFTSFLLIGLRLRDEVRNLPCTYKCRHDAAADLIHIYAYTKSFFKIRVSPISY